MATGLGSKEDQLRLPQLSHQSQLQSQASTALESGSASVTKTATIFTTEPKATSPTVISSTSTKDSIKHPSIFLSKKPTVASTGSRPLLKPFARSTGYSNQGKLDSEPPKSARGIPISLPGLTPTSSSLVSRPATAPFVFDNHTTYNDSGSEDSIQNDHSETSSKLRSDVDPLAASKGHGTLTILRIKRKRNEEPLDTLVVQENESAATKKQKKLNDGLHDPALRQVEDITVTKPQPAVFRLATTVNTESFKDPVHSIQLREKITHLTETSRPRPRPSDRPAQGFEDRIHHRRGQLVQGKQEETRTARYRVINQNRTGLKQTPPQVKSSVEAEAEAILDVFKMYDAVKEDDPKVTKEHAQTSEESDIMCNFLPMVREYLSISDKIVDPMVTFETSNGQSSTTNSKEDTLNDEDDYVYDIYYCDPHADHHQELRHRTIGAFDDENDYIHDDSSEYADDDSDSNAEDYYRNDYPDEELSEDEYPYELSDTDDDEYLY
ncbi:hypothetical protein BGX34_010576 [Mortierella sp. NVP85]|nr:hypothetical protein BGX34_010576 [Mortierella sp. NVP85]